jgi:hypothetical protein
VLPDRNCLPGPAPRRAPQTPGTVIANKTGAPYSCETIAPPAKYLSLDPETIASAAVQGNSVRYRFALLDDQLDPIEDQRRMIGIILAGNEWESAFDLLDGAAIGIDRIEAKLTAEPAPIAIPAAAPGAEAAPATIPQAPRQFSIPRYLPPRQPTASREAILAATSLATPPPRHHAA